jgi:hypothetical protein
MDARARSAANAGANKVKHRLLAARSRIKGDTHALTQILGATPVAGQPFPDTSAAIAQLSKHLGTLHADVQRQGGGGAQGKQARQLTARTIQDTQKSLAKLAAASKATDQAAAVKLINEGLRLLHEAKLTSHKAGKAMQGTWPI